MTLTLKLAEGDRVFKVAAKTKFSCGEKPALLKDVGVGKTMEAVIKMVHGQADEVVSVNIMADEATGSASDGKDHTKSHKRPKKYDRPFPP